MAFDVVNISKNNDSVLRPLGQPHLFFRRIRVLCGSALVEDIDEWGRWSQQMHLLQPKNKRTNDFVEGFNGEVMGLASEIDSTMLTIPGGQRVTVMFTPLTGLLSQDRYLPLRYCPITLEIEICNSYSDPTIDNTGPTYTADGTTTSSGIVF